MDVGIALFNNYNFLIFKQDIDKKQGGNVNAHRVLIGYNEVQY